MTQPRFGQKVRGIYASMDNPIRDGYFVEVIQRTGRLNPGIWYRLTDGRGKFWEYQPASVEILQEWLDTPAQKE